MHNDMMHMTVQEAIYFLEKKVVLRSLREKIEKYYHGQNLRQELVSGLLYNHPGLGIEAIERRVRNWVNNKKLLSIKKNDAIEICFILKFSIEDANGFVSLVSEKALHWRNPNEIVYIFALKQGMDYLEAQELNRRMQAILSDVKDSKKLQENSFTPIVRKEIFALNTVEELTDYLKDAVSRLGRYHNNAYKFFMEMMDMLENPRLDETVEQAGLFDSEHLTIRDILREYLFADNVLYAKELVCEYKKKGAEFSDNKKFTFTPVQESVSANWPDETSLSKMKLRKTDVTRKVLILLFLATQGLDMYEDDEYEYGFESDEYALFEDLRDRLNDMLILCGYGKLDSRSPFDWLIKYCISVTDICDVDIRMKTVFREMFGERPKE